MGLWKRMSLRSCKCANPDYQNYVRRRLKQSVPWRSWSTRRDLSPGRSARGLDCARTFLTPIRSFAYQLGAGLGYEVTDAITVQVGYRMLKSNHVGVQRRQE